MAASEVHIEMLLSKRVVDKEGKAAGRIEEVRAEEQGGEWVVKEYHIGAAALFERLSAMSLGSAVASLLGGKGSGGYKVPWDKMDLSDPEKPRLTCSREELEKLR
jgi:sporulation protein YlmC with PRC-barrel domain